MLFEKELNEVSGRLRKEEMCRFVMCVECWVKLCFGDVIGVEFNKFGLGCGGFGVFEMGDKFLIEKDFWDCIWIVFMDVVKEVEECFVDRVKSFDVSDEEVLIGIWCLCWKSWVVFCEKIEEEVMEGNILLKFRENFEDKF